MSPKAIILMRHAERLDRALEAKGEDWISTADRPQDPPLSSAGCQQAHYMGQYLRKYPIHKILCSPFIRCVQTADIVAEELGLTENSICVETGLIEEAKSMRGKCPPEPLPVWNPLFLSPLQLQAHSSRIDCNYQTLQNVIHEINEEIPNHVQETLLESSETSRDVVTRLRCQRFIDALLSHDEFGKDQNVLCVGHGATVKYFSEALQNGIPKDKMIGGERCVACCAIFLPRPTEDNDENPEEYCWYSPDASWRSPLNVREDLACETVDNIEDRG